MSGDTIYSSAYGNDGFRRFLIRVFIPIFALVLFAAVIYFPFLTENVHLPFVVGWCIYFIIPMGIALFSSWHFYRKHQTQSYDPTFMGTALIIMGWLFFSLNWAFLGYPWPWEGWGSWPWSKWGGPNSTATFFLASMITLTTMVFKGNKQDSIFDDTDYRP